MSGRDSFRPYLEAHFASGSRKCAVFAQLAPTQNHLAALPVEDYERLLPDLEMDFTEAELAARENAEAAADVQRQIEAMPKSAEAYRKSTIDMLDRFTAAVIGVASDTSFDGYRLHPETISELQLLAGHMVNAIEIGEVVFDRKPRIAAEIKIRVKAAKADQAVQSFMRRVTGAQGASE